MKWNKLEEIIRHAYNTVPLYVDIAEREDIDIERVKFSDLPIVDKSFYITHGMSVLSSEYIGKYIQKKLIWGRTSGSTGKYGEVYWDEVELRKSLFSLWCYRRKYYNILATDKLCYFFSGDIGDMEQYEKDNIMAFSRKCLFDDTLEKVYQQIVEFNPVWMILQPSISILLCNLIEKFHLAVPSELRYIEFTGEYLEEKVRERTKHIFGCMVANQYGTKEVNSIAYECPEGNMHIMSDNVFVETISDGNCDSNEICVTTLQNRAMPLIRFRVGDRGKLLSHRTCTCGNSNKILELRNGRQNDWIKRKDGTRVHAYAVMQIMNEVNYEMDGEILQYQIIQKAYDMFLFMITMEEMDYASNIEEVIRERMLQRLGAETEIVVQILEELLPDEKTGKLACFQCEI